MQKSKPLTKLTNIAIAIFYIGLVSVAVLYGPAIAALWPLF